VLGTPAATRDALGFLRRAAAVYKAALQDEPTSAVSVRAATCDLSLARVELRCGNPAPWREGFLPAFEILRQGWEAEEIPTATVLELCGEFADTVRGADELVDVDVEWLPEMLDAISIADSNQPYGSELLAEWQVVATSASLLFSKRGKLDIALELGQAAASLDDDSPESADAYEVCVQAFLAKGHAYDALHMWNRATEIREQQYGYDHEVPVSMRATSAALKKAAPTIEAKRVA
jgi:tetratricopeptide (TPR) repeat protein